MPKRPVLAAAQVLEAEPVPAIFKLYFIDGNGHVCGRAPSPIVFDPTPQDPNPHAFVRRELGDWLIEHDRNAAGEVRYEWAPEAIAVFEEDASDE